MEQKLWTVARYAAGTWDTGGRVSDPAYAECEVYQILAESRDKAKKKAQSVRSTMIRKGLTLPSQAEPYKAH
ncbi:hypothetical protein NPS53_09515 [Pseudomonas putida]|uniref:hypothetical protein n=1 Tax=Pseudomonas putida TaxID=303 RepID=UPI00236381F9|nr:hypothetical protein [Pseudomonas putida]MDD2139815.1 hypothetical protein [Pseudomonas putida]HDS1721739.1 hypothetical protein [Pseudomonas putida]